MHIPADVKEQIAKYELVEYEYRETKVNGVLFRTIIHDEDNGKCFKSFPIFQQSNPGLRIDWWIANAALEGEDPKEIEEHLNKLMYHQFMQDIFEIAEIVVSKNTSGDVYRPVIPESAYE